MRIFDILKQKSEVNTTQVVKTTKHQQVLSHLRKHGSIDSWTAIELYGATRLSAIIFNLRRRGLNIDTQTMTVKDRNNNVCNFANYILILDNN